MKWICVFFFLSFLSCDQLFLGGAVSGTHYPPSPSGTIPTSPIGTSSSASSWGVVKCSVNQNDFFQRNVRQFLNSFLDISAIGRVGCTAQDSQLKQGGFFFRGKVVFQSQESFSPALNQVLHPTEESYIELHIHAVSGPKIPAIRLSLSPAGGLIENNIVSLSFEDQRGVVTLDGGCGSRRSFFRRISLRKFYELSRVIRREIQEQ